MMPTKVTVSGRPVFGNETPATALMYSSSEHISAHYKPVLAPRDQDRAKASDIFPDPAEACTADVFPRRYALREFCKPTGGHSIPKLPLRYQPKSLQTSGLAWDV